MVAVERMAAGYPRGFWVNPSDNSMGFFLLGHYMGSNATKRAVIDASLSPFPI